MVCRDPDGRVVLLNSEQHACQPGWCADEVLARDRFKRFVVGVYVNVPTVDILVKSLKSKHDAEHFAFDWCSDLSFR